ncbi:allergin-1-like [Poeciliopsis prolifica]|uniref:allergin-1-like n=1 Tax=Poeciliopsis prolifica TaxID=188132 RepID=UPI0024136550|nr:allergin-1-like [Poeciliopsis prolifica]
MIRTGRELLLGLLLVCVFSSSPAQGCNITKECCEKKINVTECSNDFKANVNSSLSTIKESDDVTLECSHNIPALNLSYEWFWNDKKIVEDKDKYDHVNNKTLILKKVLSSRKGDYKCFVTTSCGSCESEPYHLEIENNSIVIIIVCGVAALALILIMGVAMKIKLKNDKVQHKERMKQRAEQRAQDAQNAGPIPFSRGY